MRNDLSNDMKLAYTVDFANIARSLYIVSIAVQHSTAFGLPRLCFLVQNRSRDFKHLISYSDPHLPGHASCYAASPLAAA